MAAVILVNNLTRRFGSTVALDDLSLQVRRGEIFGLLGHNGAGKTTTVRLLNGLLEASEGSARVLGLDPIEDGSRLRARTGVSTETPSLDDRMSGRAALHYFAELYGVPASTVGDRVSRLLGEFGLLGAGNDKIGTYSKGMKQRLALARTLLHDPELLFLDEPTSGLDPVAARSVNDTIMKMSRERGSTVLLCTHNLAQAQELCDRVAVLEHGRLVALGSPAELARQLGHNQKLTIDVHPDDAEGALTLLRTEGAAERHGYELHLPVVERSEIPELVARLCAHGVRIFAVGLEEPSLEQIYFALHRDEGEERA